MHRLDMVNSAKREGLQQLLEGLVLHSVILQLSILCHYNNVIIIP